MALDPLADAKSLLSGLSDDGQAEILAWFRARFPIHPLESRWGAPAEVILEAIARASDLSQRGVLGLIAEASFKVNVIDRLKGWTSIEIAGDAAFDFCISRGEEQFSIQVKRQRLERRVPKIYRRGSSLFVVETQRTRSGTDSAGESTRPYRFGDFDILAVSMQPSTDDWASFRFAPQRWLLPRASSPKLLRVMQPVSLAPNEDWSSTLLECLDRTRSQVSRRVSES
ncbi:MAG TPA: hypothetical protein PKC43_12760 [Phycisphaerales bacterium]|nr:hypothetical protein [Phycisphaerales bacterium]HMP38304.1 hypothetical protein [Phycisphaerales bacterium]